jgi:predicted PurR-regulated permease PerM
MAGIIAFGIVGAIIENAIKPIFVSKRTNVHSAIILLGMIGGLFFIGILGVIIGPLILSYLLIVLEIYRDKRVPGAFIKSPVKR